MALVTRQTSSGLVACEQAGGEAELGRAIKQIDDRYVLQKHPADVEGGWVYKVFCIVSEDQPAVCVLTWSDERGNPLPLSSGLVEEVKKWRPENRSRRGPDADQRNEQLRERTDLHRRDQLAAISAEHKPKVERARTTVSFGPLTRLSEIPRRERRRRDP